MPANRKLYCTWKGQYVDGCTCKVCLDPKLVETAKLQEVTLDGYLQT